MMLDMHSLCPDITDHRSPKAYVSWQGGDGQNLPNAWTGEHFSLDLADIWTTLVQYHG
jgi:hypothetical protein